MVGAVEVRDEDLEGIGKLLNEQREHFAELAKYARATCADTSGMTQLMALLVDKTRDLAGWSAWKLGRCAARMDATVHDLSKVRQIYADTEADNAKQLKYLFGEPIDGIRYPELSSQAAALMHDSNYKDEWDKPPAPTGESPGLNELIENRKASLISDCDNIWTFQFGGPTLSQKIIEPITGDYSKLYWLHEAYRNLGSATYNIAENCRRGHLTLGPRWNGPAATYFEYHLFAWGQGVGGLGDLFQICGRVYWWIYSTLMKVAHEILKNVLDLVNQYFPRLQEIMDRNDRFREFVEANCGRPVAGQVLIPDGILSEADIALWSRRIKETAHAVREIERLVEQYQGWVQTAKDEVSRIWENIDVASTDPGAYVLDTVHKKGQDRLVNIERPNGEYDETMNQWDPRKGVWRVALIPS
jgi:hypothetical protein